MKGLYNSQHVYTRTSLRIYIYRAFSALLLIVRVRELGSTKWEKILRVHTVDVSAKRVG